MTQGNRRVKLRNGNGSIDTIYPDNTYQNSAGWLVCVFKRASGRTDRLEKYPPSMVLQEVVSYPENGEHADAERAAEVNVGP